MVNFDKNEFNIEDCTVVFDGGLDFPHCDISVVVERQMNGGVVFAKDISGVVEFPFADPKVDFCYSEGLPKKTEFSVSGEGFTMEFRDVFFTNEPGGIEFEFVARDWERTLTESN